ncbi:MAG: FAD binding domain-containing protein [Pseudomonadota bacterium]
MRYARPTTLNDALELRASTPGITVLCGGTDLYPATERPALSGPVLDISAVEGMRGVTQTADGLRIGAATSWSTLGAGDLPPSCSALQQAAREVGAVQIQNAGTLGGNLCTASPAADGVPPLLVLEAEVELCSTRGTRRFPLGGFLTGARRTALAPDEILSAVHLPNRALAGQSVFTKLGARRYLVISIAMVAARLELEDARVRSAALAVGACSAVAQRLPRVEAALIGAAPAEAAGRIRSDAVAAALSPIDDVRGTAEYRTQAAAELLRRAVAKLCQAAPGTQPRVTAA